MKAKHCDECKHVQADESRMVCPGVRFADVIRCAKGHKPRFYMPRNYSDIEYGWKRRCNDFSPS